MLMQKIYTLLAIALAFCLSSRAQTNPAPQPLPYQQDFSALPPAGTTYPDGWQGWVMASSTSTQFRTTPPTGDKPLTASGSASSTAGAVYNYNGKLGVLNSGSSGDQGLVLAINTSGRSAVQVSFDIMTIRNPYGGSNTRINEVILQYRIGQTGNFTNLPGTEYQNNTVNQQSGTEPQNLINKNILLPDSCNNQPLVQLRWISREVSGGGSRPSFAVDNISIGGGSGGDHTPPAVTALAPANNATDVVPTTQPSITFSEPVISGSGHLVLADLTLQQQQSFSAADSAITIAGSSLTLHTTLKPLHRYAVLIDSGFVQDAAGNAFAGIRDSTGWVFTTGEQQLSFNFNNCTPSGSTVLDGGFRQYSLSGAQTWACTTFGQTGNGVQINGFANNAAQENEDWLISPAFDFAAFNYPLLSFASRSKFAGPSLQLLVSTDYDGVGNPHHFTWTAVNGRFPEVDSDVWTASSNINLGAFKNARVYIAFVYTSSAAAGASRWTIDDVMIRNADSLPPPAFTVSPKTLDFDYAQAGSQSAPQVFRLLPYNLQADVTVSASNGFTVSADSIHFSSSVVIPKDSAESHSLTLFARFQPAAANQEYQGTVRVSTQGLDSAAVALTGSSLRALKVVNWNIEWFGSPENGPANDSLQQQNVQKVLKSLNADVFALAEVVDTTRLQQVVANMPGYKYLISDYGSYADNVQDSDYAGAQKLAFVYKENIIQNPQVYGVMRYGASAGAYYNWSSGRFPFLLKATASLNGVSVPMNFVLLHAKANTGSRTEKIEAYNRRKAAALELKDTLDTYYTYKNVVVLGDFNDALNKTITTELAPDTTSSYSSFVADSSHYKSITLPLSLQGDSSTVSNANVIDNVITSNETGIAYVPGSAHVLYGVTGLVSSYGTTTTDHYPVVTRYDLSYLAKPVDIQRFTAVADSGKVKLDWTTSHEINSRYFIVERSRNGFNFEAIDTLAGHADTREAASYQVYDNKPWPGRSNYRLKQVSLDSSISYSDIQTVNLQQQSKCLKISVNGKQVTVEICSNNNGRGYIQLIDMNGRVWLTLPIIWFKGSNINRFFAPGVASGIYFIRVVQPDHAETGQVLIAK